MITRIEIDGFKSFLDFKLDVPPFLALVGPNASGKSNLFDAVDFDQESREGLGSQEALLSSRRGRPHELFHRVLKGEAVTSFEIAIHQLASVGGRHVGLATGSGAHREDGRPVESNFSFQFQGVPQEALPGDSNDSFAYLLDEFGSLAQLARYYVPDPQAMRGLAPSADIGPLRENRWNLAAVLRRMQQRVTDLGDPDSLKRPLRQVVLTSHSPVVVSELYRIQPGSLVFMDTAVRVDPDHDRVSRVTVAKPVGSEGEPGTFVSPRHVREYLSVDLMALPRPRKSRRSPIRSPYSTQSCPKAVAAAGMITSNTSGRTSISRRRRTYPHTRNGSPRPKKR